MCDAGIGLGLVGLAVRGAGELTGARAQRQAFRANEKESLDALRQTYQDINARGLEEEQAAAEEINIAAKQGRAAVSTARLAAVEAGVSGASVDALLQSIESDEAQARDSVRANLERTHRQLEREKRGAASTAASRIAAVPRPSPWATGLRIGGAVLDTANSLISRRPPKE